MKFQKAKSLLVLLALAMLIIPAGAQDGETLVYGRPYDANMDGFSLSNYYCNDFNCFYVVGAMYIDFIGVDPEIGWYAPNLRNALAENWTYSDDNRVITIELRDDLSWSDGTPITAHDVLMSYDLSMNPESHHSGEGGVGFMQQTFETVEMIDEYTIRITMNERNCNAIDTISQNFDVLPAHIYQTLLDEVGYAELQNHPWFDAPSVVSGQWQFESLTENATITLSRNEDYNDIGQELDSSIQQFRQQSILEETEITPEWFLESDVTVLETVPSSNQQAFLDASERGDLQLYQYTDDSFVLMAMNNADPTNPQPSLDATGDRIEQGYHPIFSDAIVRQAMAYAINVEQMIGDVVTGFASPLASQTLSTSWAFNSELSPIQQDIDYALSLLAEAGWLPENPELPVSIDNRLVCVDCLYAREVDADFNGTHLEFELLVAGLIAEAEFIQAQLADIGITVELDSENFFGSLLGQTYDAALLGFNGAYPYNPVSTTLFGVNSDVPQAGLNVTSFYNEAYFALEETALTVPNCGITERAEIYQQMQVIMRDHMPVVWLYTRDAMFVAKNDLIGFDPRPDNWWWNVNTWRIVTPEE